MKLGLFNLIGKLQGEEVLSLLCPVGVLPALHQHHQGVEPEEDDDGNDDALEDDPDVDMFRASNPSVVSQLLDRCRWVLEAKGVRSPHNQVEQDQKGHNLQSPGERQ